MNLAQLTEISKDIKYSILRKKWMKYYSFTDEQMEYALDAYYYKKTGAHIDFNKPLTFNEKIQWLKLYDATQFKADLSDKYSVRNWVENKIGGDYLIPLIKSWDSVDDIEFSMLPKNCVLKATHGCGTNIIIHDRNIDIKVAKSQLSRWMKTNYAFKMGFELHYGLIKPRIVCEELIADGNLNDYKFFCFDGKTQFVWVDINRFTNHTRNIYDMTWSELPFMVNTSIPKEKAPKPRNFEEMIRIAEVLSSSIPFVRVDLYNVDGKIYFGEMTFTSSSGMSAFSPDEYNRIFGEMIKLPEKKNLPLGKMKEIWGDN